MPKIGERKTNCQNPFQAIIRLKKKKKKWHGLLNHWCRDGKTLVVRPLKKNTFFICVFPYLAGGSRRVIVETTYLQFIRVVISFAAAYEHYVHYVLFVSL